MILKFRIRNQQKNTESKSVNLIFQKDELDTKINQQIYIGKRKISFNFETGFHFYC